MTSANKVPHAPIELMLEPDRSILRLTRQNNNRSGGPQSLTFKISTESNQPFIVPTYTPQGTCWVDNNLGMTGSHDWGTVKTEEHPFRFPTRTFRVGDWKAILKENEGESHHQIEIIHTSEPGTVLYYSMLCTLPSTMKIYDAIKIPKPEGDDSDYEMGPNRSDGVIASARFKTEAEFPEPTDGMLEVSKAELNASVRNMGIPEDKATQSADDLYTICVLSLSSKLVDEYEHPSLAAGRRWKKESDRKFEAGRRQAHRVKGLGEPKPLAGRSA